MISYLLNGNYPGADIGPEPTTDIFAHVEYSERTETLSGVTLASDSSYQFQVYYALFLFGCSANFGIFTSNLRQCAFQALNMFGDTFLSKLKATRFKAPLLKYISIIDTPGILTGDKQVTLFKFY